MSRPLTLGAAAALALAGVAAAPRPTPSGSAELPIAVGPVLWYKPEINKRLLVQVLVQGSRNVGYIATVPPDLEIRPVLAPHVTALSRLTDQSGGAMALNGAFFNRADGVPASYIVVNGVTVADPHQNKLLVENSNLQAHLPKIFDRPEWRVWDTPAGRHVAFEPHHIKPAPRWKLVHALQAGPLLMPFLGLREGAFVRGKDDAVASDRRLGRSAIGLRSDGVSLLVTVPKPPSPGMTILELQKFLGHVGATQAMALDGGEASGFVLRPPDPAALWWGHDAKVRSALVVFAAPKKTHPVRRSNPDAKH